MPSESREYPAGALGAIGLLHGSMILDALAAMRETDRAELARWLWPEGEDAPKEDGA
jgi:hypothetical protein